MERRGVLLAVVIAALFGIVSLQAVLRGAPTPLALLVRLFALNAFCALAVAAMMTPFLGEIRAVFGRPFIRMHHFFVAFGLSAAILHPLSVAVLAASPSVFIPSFASWGAFWALAGRPALYMLIIAAGAAIFRRRLGGAWRFLHMLVYLALLFAIVHANLIGTDLADPVVGIILNGAALGVFAAFVLKRYRRWRR
ncbi:hypothetical protein [Methanofollis fontis]|uniref:Ferric oxidoreductase domain-containing protein n=1 Tax=Methanofollis fontis TaxID=2052832 RepID=A0A483CXA0_9EURY|nr:hypothetical protein [Methanofollis fontis]TAJ43843.1 hypothetical protein CUJ86_07180 [Methanofollis fontis]